MCIKCAWKWAHGVSARSLSLSSYTLYVEQNLWANRNICVLKRCVRGNAELLNRIRDLRLKLIRIILGAVCGALFVYRRNESVASGERDWGRGEGVVELATKYVVAFFITHSKEIAHRHIITATKCAHNHQTVYVCQEKTIDWIRDNSILCIGFLEENCKSPSVGFVWCNSIATCLIRTHRKHVYWNIVLSICFVNAIRTARRTVDASQTSVHEGKWILSNIYSVR